MQVYDFTNPELDMLRQQCNFSDEELEYFNLRAKHLSNVQKFRMYVAVKRKYQLKELSKDDLIFAMKSMCRDIEEFIDTLYNNTELPEERELIKVMLENARSVI